VTKKSRPQGARCPVSRNRPVICYASDCTVFGRPGHRQRANDEPTEQDESEPQELFGGLAAARHCPRAVVDDAPSRRYLPEVSGKFAQSTRFWGLQTPELAVEVSLQPCAGWMSTP